MRSKEDKKIASSSPLKSRQFQLPYSQITKIEQNNQNQKQQANSAPTARSFNLLSSLSYYKGTPSLKYPLYCTAAPSQLAIPLWIGQCLFPLSQANLLSNYSKIFVQRYSFFSLLPVFLSGFGFLVSRVSGVFPISLISSTYLPVIYDKWAAQYRDARLGQSERVL